MKKNKLEKVENTEEKKHGGRRPGSGRKPNLNKAAIKIIKERIAIHGMQEVEVKRNKKFLRMTRVEALLDMLYLQGMKNNVYAAKEYLDRQLGKAEQPIKGTGDDDEIIVRVLGDADKFKLK